MTEPTTPKPASDPNAAKPSFEASMQRLDKIVQDLESGQVTLEQAMALFEEGLTLSASCRGILDAAQAKVEKLLERPDGSAEVRPFEAP